MGRGARGYRLAGLVLRGLGLELVAAPKSNFILAGSLKMLPLENSGMCGDSHQLSQASVERVLKDSRGAGPSDDTDTFGLGLGGQMAVAMTSAIGTGMRGSKEVMALLI